MENLFRNSWERCKNSVGAFDRNGDLIKAEKSKSGLFDIYACKCFEVSILGLNPKKLIISGYGSDLCCETNAIIYTAHKHKSMDIESVIGTDKERLEKEAKLGTSQCRYCMYFEAKK
jgi:hypothetical protein